MNSDQAVEWPTPEPALVRDVAGTGLTIYRETYGALSQDRDNPLSRVSVTNSTFSLDPYVGCPAKCAYCVVASSSRDLLLDPAQTLALRLPARPKRMFHGVELVRALVNHPAFIADRSIISIGTGSTESFLPQVEAETWNVLEYVAQIGLRNPIWIVTKMGISDSLISTWLSRFRVLQNHSIPLVLSITYSAAPAWMEPYRGDRFRHIEPIRDAGVRISHHLRPILRGVNDSFVSANQALRASHGLAEIICIGGLRPDSGIKLAWQFINKLDPSLLPETIAKDLPESYEEHVGRALSSLGSDVPVVFRSAQALAFLLAKPNFDIHKYEPSDGDAFLSVPENIQSVISERSGTPFCSVVERCAHDIGLTTITVTADREKIFLDPPMRYQERTLLKHALGHSELFAAAKELPALENQGTAVDFIGSN